MTPDVLTSLPWTALPLPRDRATGAPYVVTSGYGQRSTGFHYGADLATRAADGNPTTGLPVYAVTAAVVVRVVDDNRGGLVVVLEDAHGDEVKYSHLESTDVDVGDLVQPGEEIARSGRSGIVRGPHLHLESWQNGAAVDPEPQLAEAASYVREHGQPSSTLATAVPALGFAAALFLLLRRFLKW